MKLLKVARGDEVSAGLLISLFCACTILIDWKINIENSMNAKTVLKYFARNLLLINGI